MAARTLLGMALLALALTTPAQAQPSVAADPNKVSELIKLLGSERFQDRASAQKQLEAIGPPALDLLRKAMKTSDLETSRRADDLVRKIEEKRDTEYALAPKLVWLDIDDLTARQAVNLLARESGYAIEIRESRPGIAERRITLNTGLVPFWRALDLVCKEASLSERRPPGGLGAIISNGPMGDLIMVRPAGAESVVPPRGIFLHTESPVRVHTSLAGSVRLRLYEMPGGGVEDYKLLLEVSPEPRLLAFNPESPRITQALDDQEQERVAKNVTAVEGSERLWLLSFFPAAKPAQTLKALSGSLTAWTMGPPRPSVTIGEILGQRQVGQKQKWRTDPGGMAEENVRRRLRVARQLANRCPNARVAKVCAHQGGYSRRQIPPRAPFA